MTYNFDKHVDRRGTYSIKWDSLREQYGSDAIVPFTIADSDFALPEVVQRALIERIQHPIYGYTSWDHADFKNAIVNWFGQHFATVIDPQSIVYGPTVMYMIKTLLVLLARDKQVETLRVIVQNPAYDGFTKLLHGLQYPLTVWDFIGDQSFLTELETLCAAEQNQVLLLCHPHNPTGIDLSSEILTEIFAICKRYGVFVISDEIHMDLVYEPLRHTPAIQIAERLDMLDAVALITSASKTFNMSGLQGGYMVLPPEPLRLAYIENLRCVDNLFGASIIGLTGLMAGYGAGYDWLVAMKSYLSGTLDWIETFISSESLPIGFKRPDATYLIWLDMSEFGLTEAVLYETLLTAGIAFAPGANYLLSPGNYLRMNIATPRANVQEAFYILRDIHRKAISTV